MRAAEKKALRPLRRCRAHARDERARKRSRGAHKRLPQAPLQRQHPTRRERSRRPIAAKPPRMAKSARGREERTGEPARPAVPSSAAASSSTNEGSSRRDLQHTNPQEGSSSGAEAAELWTSRAVRRRIEERDDVPHKQTRPRTRPKLDTEPRLGRLRDLDLCWQPTPHLARPRTTRRKRARRTSPRRPAESRKLAPARA